MLKLPTILLLVAIIVVNGRPEGEAKKSETLREGKAQTQLDSGSLPTLNDKDENILKREAKESPTLINGGIIPVHLIYDPNDQETVAVVKEINAAGVKIDIRRRDIIKRGISDSDSDGKELSFNARVVYGPNSRKNSLKRSIDNSASSNKLSNTKYNIDLDLFNKELGIEAREYPQSPDFGPYESFNLHSNSETFDIDNPIEIYIKNLMRTINDNNKKFQRFKHKLEHYYSFMEPNFWINSQTFDLGDQTEILKKLFAHNVPFVRRPEILPFIYQNPYFDYLRYLRRNVNSVVNNPQPGENGTPHWKVYIPQRSKAKSRTKRGILKSPSPPWANPTPGPSNAGNSGPQIMRLKVRNGGVAIAGPGGIATAGSGGTAIVGPGGTAYTAADGIAVVGPSGKLIHVPSSNFKATTVVKARDGSNRVKLQSAKLVATGPVIYYPTKVERLNLNKDSPLMVYLPEYNVFLLPADSVQQQGGSQRRRRPLLTLIKLLQTRPDFGNLQQTLNKLQMSANNEINGTNSSQNSGDGQNNSENSIKGENMTNGFSGGSESEVGQASFGQQIIGLKPQFNPQPFFNHNTPSNMPYFRPLPSPAGINNVPNYFYNSQMFKSQPNYLLRKEYPSLYSSVLPVKERLIKEVRDGIQKSAVGSQEGSYFENKVPVLSSHIKDNIQMFSMSREDSDRVEQERGTITGPVDDWDAYIDKLGGPELFSTVTMEEDAEDSPLVMASVPVGNRKATNLVLKPVAKAVAGPRGVAVASPIARAVLRRGQEVSIDFDPDAVAVAGPGGTAHSHPKLIISYMKDDDAFNAEARTLENSEKLSFYGGALGRFLVIHPSGKMSIVGERRPPGGRKESDDEEDVGVADEGPNDTVAINKPPENASIAEAKPVAVSIAGHGGMASAQPIATAVVGPGGLALTRPIATAIAGIDGAENLVAAQPPQAAAKSGSSIAGHNTNLLYGLVQPQAVFFYPVPIY